MVFATPVSASPTPSPRVKLFRTRNGRLKTFIYIKQTKAVYLYVRTTLRPIRKIYVRVFMSFIYVKIVKVTFSRNARYIFLFFVSEIFYILSRSRLHPGTKNKIYYYNNIIYIFYTQQSILFFYFFFVCSFYTRCIYFDVQRFDEKKRQKTGRYTHTLTIYTSISRIQTTFKEICFFFLPFFELIHPDSLYVGSKTKRTLAYVRPTEREKTPSDRVASKWK